MRDSRLPTEVRKAINRTPIAFWSCLNDDHQLVTWNGDVATCDTCGLTSDMTDRFVRSIREHAADRVLLVSEVTRGLRCPTCHGKPATQPHPLDTDPTYRCGAGHVWRRPLVIEDSSAHPEVLLRHVAETGELPPVPTRIEQEAADG